MEGKKKINSSSFRQYSWNSEVETTWIRLIGWHHKTSSLDVLRRAVRTGGVGILFEDQMAVEFLKNFEIISKPSDFDLFSNLGETLEEFLEQIA